MFCFGVEQFPLSKVGFSLFCEKERPYRPQYEILVGRSNEMLVSAFDVLEIVFYFPKDDLITWEESLFRE